MTDSRLGNLGVLGIHGFDQSMNFNISKCCEEFKLRNPRRMTYCSSILHDSDD